MNNIYGIDKKSHYFVLMHPIELYGPVAIKSSGTREKWVECVIVEESYKVDDGYKVELRSIEEGYGKETFYQEDFISLLNSGSVVVKKEAEDMVCVEEKWREPLSGSVYLEHSAYTLKRTKK